MNMKKGIVLCGVFATACSVFGARAYRAPAPAWPPRPLDDLNGRKLELFVHGAEKAWGYADVREDVFALAHPRAGSPTPAPLVVVLHSAGHNLLTCLKCVRQVGNHDIYTTPDCAFGLYVDCAYNGGRDWWWGAAEAQDRGLAESPLEKRVLATIAWVTRTYGVDSNRVYLCGNSMGAAGTLGIGLRHGDVFAAVKSNTPAGFAQALGRLGAGGAEPAGLPEPPVCVDYSSQVDKWSVDHEKLLALMHERRYPLLCFWGAFGHANDDAVMDRYNDVIRAFDWLAVRKDEPYPVFTDATSDNPSPWPVREKNGGTTATDLRPGQINGFFRWKAVSCTAARVEMDLSLAHPATKFAELKAPERASAGVCLRRLGAFKAPAGTPVRWRFGARNGTAQTSAQGVQLPALEMTASPVRLTVER